MPRGRAGRGAAPRAQGGAGDGGPCPGGEPAGVPPVPGLLPGAAPPGVWVVRLGFWLGVLKMDLHVSECICTCVYLIQQGATDSAITPSTSSNSIDAADDATPTPTPTPNPPALNGPPVVILISHTAEPGSAASSALAAALQGGGQGPPTTQGASRRKGLRKVIEGLRRFGPIYLVEGDASTEEGLVYVFTYFLSFLRAGGSCTYKIYNYLYIYRYTHSLRFAARRGWSGPGRA